MVVYVLDRFYLSITLLVTVAYQLTGFAIAWSLQFDKITDFTGGSNFFLLGLLTLLIGNEFHTRQIVATVLVLIWSMRIAGFLLYRVLKTGSDTRFDEIRSNFFKFLGFWVGQILWIWTVSLPLTILNSPAVSDTANTGSNPSFGTARDIVGIILWVIGWLVETMADAQKFRYKQSKSSPKDRPIQAGLWGWSRHPSYFGEKVMLCWWGIWTLCLSPTTNGDLTESAKSAQYGSVVSPLFTVLLLMFGSGIPTSAKPQARRYFLMAKGPDAKPEHRDAWSRYKEYLNSTSILVPIPPVIYRPLPQFIKSTVLLDFAIYRFDEETDGKRALGNGS